MIRNSKSLTTHIKSLPFQVKEAITFTLLLFAYLALELIATFFRLIKKNFPKENLHVKLRKLLDGNRQGRIGRIELIRLSLKNMSTKRTRTVITIGGMTIGISVIVFLVSIGYGLQQLVVQRIARLEEMRQADVTTKVSSQIKITDETLANFKDIKQIETSLPMIAVVGKISYQNSVTDLAVYGVTTSYLESSAIKPVRGRNFENNDTFITLDHPKQVAGLTDEKPIGEAGKFIQLVDYSIPLDAWLRVRVKPDIASDLLGYTTREGGYQTGEEVWGSAFTHSLGRGNLGINKQGITLGKWIKTKVYLYKQISCTEAEHGCIAGAYLPIVDEDNLPVQTEGYIAQTDLEVYPSISNPTPQVLGDSTSDNWVEIASESAALEQLNIKRVNISSQTPKEAVVNRSLLNVLGIKESESLNQKFSVSYVVIGDLLDDSTERIESESLEYTIVGVIPDESAPHLFVPFIDIRSLGVNNYSQVKVIVSDQNSLSTTRKQIESMGYITNSVADTVTQINSLFSTVRTVLAIIGLIALAIAALGMFNTLTVSLLERTREIGLMKAMGMKSAEIQELFLTESMIMGTLGGVFGIILGFLIGKALELILSIFTISKGLGTISVTDIPLGLSLTIIGLSLFIGVITGIFPAKRATKISALNSLRYE